MELEPSLFRILEDKTRLFQQNLDILASERGVPLQQYTSSGGVSYFSLKVALVVHLLVGLL